MKKMFSFMLVVLTSLTMSAATLNLSLNDLVGDNSTGWGGVTYDVGSQIMSFPNAWEGGLGWWIADDWSAYERVVVEFAPAPCKIQLVVEYYGADTETSNGFEKAVCGAGEKSVALALDPARKNKVQKVYLQSEAKADLQLTKAYATSDAETDPTQGLTPSEDLRTDEYGYVPLAVLQQYSYFEVIITMNHDIDHVTYGIGEIIPVSNYDVISYTFLCKNKGMGAQNRYVFTQEEMLGFAKVNGTFWTDEYNRQGVHIKAYDNEGVLVSVKGFKGGSTNPEQPQLQSEVITPDDINTEYNFTWLSLATIQKYEKIDIVVTVTDASVGIGWGIGRIVPANFWTGPSVEMKSVVAGAQDNVLTFTQAQMIEMSKVDGTIYTDEQNRQGVYMQAYTDKAQIKEIRGYRSQTSSVETVASQNLIEKVGINLYRSAQNILVFNLTGANVLGGTEVDLNTLPQGVYVLRSGNQTLKVSR